MEGDRTPEDTIPRVPRPPVVDRLVYEDLLTSEFKEYMTLMSMRVEPICATKYRLTFQVAIDFTVSDETFVHGTDEVVKLMIKRAEHDLVKRVKEMAFGDSFKTLDRGFYSLYGRALIPDMMCPKGIILVHPETLSMIMTNGNYDHYNCSVMKKQEDR